MIDAEVVSRSLMEPVVALDTGGVVSYANERFLEITQRPRERVLGAHYTALEEFIEEGFGAFSAAIEAIAATNSDQERVEIVMVHPEAAPVPRRLPAEARLTPVVSNGARIGVLVVWRNIAERKRKEEQLERQNARLEEFASVVSHDLRNPLNVAQGRLELARGECDSDHLDEVAYAHDRMEELIEDVLALARRGNVRPEVEAVDLATTVEACWRNVETGEARLVTETSVVYADRGRLQQLLENLIRNAVEHCGADVTVTVGDLEDGFYVEDDGGGIPTDAREHVFDVGYSTTPNGMGFGLSIAKEIADAHGWDVTVTNGTDGGARFEFSGVELE